LKKELNNVEISNNFFLSKLINNINFFLLEIIKNSFNYQSIFSIYKEKIMNSKDKLKYTFYNNGNKFDGEIIDIEPNGSLLVKDRQKNKIIQISSTYNINPN
jgi:biotin-(acetyl-CoA carboxylase) ligase